jgi:hypothetical protein
MHLENQSFRPWLDMSCLASWPNLKELLLYGYTEPLLISLTRSAHALRHLQCVTWSCGYVMSETERQALQQELSPCSLRWDGMRLWRHSTDHPCTIPVTDTSNDCAVDGIRSAEHMMQHLLLSAHVEIQATEEERNEQAAAMMVEEAARVAHEQWATNIEANIGIMQADQPCATNLGNETDEEQIFIRRFTRSPRSFRQALRTSEPLQQCCNSLVAAGLSVELSSGALAFVSPRILPHVEEAAIFQGIQLRRHHVVCSRNFYPAVTAVVASLRSNDNVRQRNEAVLKVLDLVAARAFFAREASAVQIIVGSVPMEVRNTFLNIPIRAEIPRSAATQSTGDAHGMVNPRQALMAADLV